jgi:hypothetical protein
MVGQLGFPGTGGIFAQSCSAQARMMIVAVPKRFGREVRAHAAPKEEKK